MPRVSGKIPREGCGRGEAEGPSAGLQRGASEMQEGEGLAFSMRHTKLYAQEGIFTVKDNRVSFKWLVIHDF